MAIYIVPRYTGFMKRKTQKKYTRHPIDYQSLSSFRYEIRLFLDFVQRVARRAAIEPQQYQALLEIRGLRTEAKPTVGTLAERMCLRHHSAAELSVRLERRGWIARTRSTEDQREVLLRLTPRGQSRLDTLSRMHQQELQIQAPRLIEALRAVVRARKARRK